MNKIVVLISNLPRQIAYFLEEKLSKIKILFNLGGVKKRIKRIISHFR